MVVAPRATLGADRGSTSRSRLARRSVTGHGGILRRMPDGLPPAARSDDRPLAAAGNGGLRPPADRSPVEAALAEADHWRRTARQRAAALDGLQRQPLVRLAVAVDRRSIPLRRAAHRAREQLRRAGSLARLSGSAALHRPALARRRRELAESLASLPAPPPISPSVSIVVAPGAEAVPGAAMAQLAGDGGHEVVVVRSEGRVPAGAVDRAVGDAQGDLVCLLGSVRPLEPGWLARLAAPIGHGVVAAVPQLVHPERPAHRATPHDLVVREEGLDVVAQAGTPRVRGRRAGSPVDVGRHPTEVDAGSAACFLVERRAYLRAGGLAPLPSLDAAVVDLCARLRREGGRVVAVPGALVEDLRPVGSTAALCEPLAPPSPAWRDLVEERGPALLRLASPCGGLRVVCTVACPSAKVAARWGDWHLTQAMAASLRRHGHEVRVQIAPEADDPAGRCCDVHVVVRGLVPVRRSSGQRHVLWVISHPEAVETSECDEADLVLVASHRFAEALRQRTTTPVEVLLQATDHRRFRPVAPDPAHRHAVTVVAKTREVMRHVVADALAAGLRPAIYGGGWQGFVDDALVVADHVANEELPVVYSSAGVVLNDHWETMRAWGFVSNRLFDVVACGTPVVSDHLPEIVDIFGDAVATYRTADELGATVRAILDDPDAARARSGAGRQLLLDRHTFDHRAGELLDALVRHGLVGAEAARATVGGG